MQFIKITPENAREMLGQQIVFRRKNGEKVMRTVLGVTESGKVLKIDYPRLHNEIQCVTRAIYCVV